MRRPIEDRVVVITGAASGIGLAIAYRIAARGGWLVLAGRGGVALEAAALECREAGGHVIAVPTDVGDETQVDALATRAAETFGRVDVWINNAAVTAFGRLDEVPTVVFRRVIETNLYGYLYGMRAALRLMREQQGGTIINVVSGVVAAPQPFTSAYVTSKFAVQGLSRSARMELLLERSPIEVCAVHPPATDTPLFQRGANFSGRAIRPIPPIHEPEEVADAIIEVMQHPRPETFVGVPRRALAVGEMLTPRLLDRALARRTKRGHFARRWAERSEGNVFKSVSNEPELRGGWGMTRQRKAGGPIVCAVAAVAGTLLLAIWSSHRRSSATQPARTSGTERVGRL